MPGIPHPDEVQRLLRERGLYEKFAVERTDGKSKIGEKHEGCEYFVLDLTHDPHAGGAAGFTGRADKIEERQIPPPTGVSGKQRPLAEILTEENHA